MIRDDIERLKRPYTEDEPNHETRFAQRLGVYVESLDKLADEIMADLSPHTFGVSWWHETLPAPQRILIADQLWSCAQSVQVNLVEAALHMLELRGAWTRESDRHADMLQYDARGSVVSRMGPSSSPLDELPNAMVHLHTAGVFRAVGSALDCLGCTMVGVAGLKKSILRSDFDKALEAISKSAQGSGPAAVEMATLKTTCDEAIERAGPHGWLKWATDYRNMFVHRGRRSQLMHSVPRSQLFRADGRPSLRLESFPVLAIDPGQSEIEVFQHSGLNVLTESAEVTLEELIRGSTFLVGAVGRTLLALWERRRADPKLITQPVEQWKDPVSRSGEFRGYRPGSTPHDPGSVVVNPTVTRRLESASLRDDQARANWKKWLT